MRISRTSPGKRDGILAGWCTVLGFVGRDFEFPVLKHFSPGNDRIGVILVQRQGVQRHIASHWRFPVIRHRSSNRVTFGIVAFRKMRTRTGDRNDTDENNQACSCNLSIHRERLPVHGCKVSRAPRYRWSLAGNGRSHHQTGTGLQRDGTNRSPPSSRCCS